MSPNRFSLRQLEAFAAVAGQGGFSPAARHLNLSPSAVSGLVADLEAALGFALFERTTRKVALTPAGHEFLPAALAVQRQMRLAATAAKDVRRGVSGIVRVAAPLVVASVILPPAMAAYARQNPGVTLRILDTPVQWLADRVEIREADMALGPDRRTPEGVRCEPLRQSPWVLWCSPQHALAGQPTVRWSELRGLDLCAAGHDHEESVAQMNIDLPDDQRITPSHVVDNISTALGLAAANLTVTVCPAYVEAMARPMGLLMRPIVEPEVLRQISLYLPNARALSPAAAGFAEFLRTHLRGRGPLGLGPASLPAKTSRSGSTGAIQG